MTIVGVPITKYMAGDTKGTIEYIRRIEDMGIRAVWMTTGPGHAGPSINMDALTVLAAASLQTERILMGTSIVPILPRHPIVVAQQTQVIDELSNGRIRVGVGTGHEQTMNTAINHPFDSPLGHLREYLRILKALFKDGRVDFHGRYFCANVDMPAPLDVPVMASALGPRSFELCGAEADGAISWLCPWQYLRDVALPRMKKGAEAAGRQVPPLLAHVPVIADASLDQVRGAMRQHVATNPGNAEFANMFRAAGFDEVDKGEWSDRMIEAVALYGDEGQITEGLRRLASIGASEIVASPIPVGADVKGSIDGTLKVLARAQATLDS